MLDNQSPRTFANPNDYASSHGEEFCGAIPEGADRYPRHCLHGSEEPSCCWCGDVFVSDSKNTQHGSNFHQLSKREVEVLQLIAEGYSNKLIAKRLKISTHTVKFHVDRVIKRLGEINRTSAAVEGIRRGIIR